MKLPRRPPRFIVIPPPSSPAAAPTSVQAMRLMHIGSRGAATAARKTAPVAVPAVRFKVVNRSPADGALLLEPRDHLTLDQLEGQAPQGAKVLREQWYALERPARPRP